MQNDPVVIVAAKRTAIGAFQGQFGAVSAPELGSVAIRAAIEEAKLDQIDEVYMGCVLSAGLGQAPARQAALGAGLHERTPCTTVNKMCGSGLKTVMLAHDALLAGNGEAIVAGGLESMTNAPYLLPKVRQGLRLGHADIKDHMFFDGLEDAYDKGQLMGVFAENTAEKYQLTREQQDAFAIRSLERAQAAIESGAFKNEIASVAVKNRKSVQDIDTDEGPGNAKIDKIPTLRPAFKPDGTVTAANASSISDGAAALVLMRESVAKAKGCQIMARIVGHATLAQAPQWFTTAPVGAIESLLTKIDWHVDQVDLFEINEAFAVVTMAAIQSLELSPEKVNIHGGACALGHPIGASGARILVTLTHALAAQGLKRGIASLCIGGGEAVAVAIERV